MGSYGNTASLRKIGDLCGIGKGTVDKVCRQVIIAIQSINLRITHIRWPAKSERKEVQRWIEEQAEVKEWRNGFCIIDDHKLEIEVDWLKEGTYWERDQNRDIKKDPVAEHMSVGGRWARQVLVAGKRVCEHKKYQLLQILNDSTYL